MRGPKVLRSERSVFPFHASCRSCLASQYQGSKERRRGLEARSLECSPHERAWTSILKLKEGGIGRGRRERGGGGDGRGEGERNGWENAIQGGIPHSRLPNAKQPFTSQTELGNLHVRNRKSWAGKSSFFGFSPPFPHTRPSFLHSLSSTCMLRCLPRGRTRSALPAP